MIARIIYEFLGFEYCFKPTDPIPGQILEECDGSTTSSYISSTIQPIDPMFEINEKWHNVQLFDGNMIWI